MNLQETIRRILKEETQGIDNFLDELSNVYDISEELRDFLKNFIEKSNCKRINIANLNMGAAGLALDTGVLINKKLFNSYPLPFLLFVIFHEISHQYQFKKYGEDIMYKCYLGEISIKESAEFMKQVEEVADEFATRKIRDIQNKGLITKSFIPPQVYKNTPLVKIEQLISYFRDMMKKNNVDTPKKVSEFIYNMTKSEL